MNAEQIRLCAEEIRQHGGSIEEILTRHVAAAKEVDGDVAWLRWAAKNCFTNGEYKRNLLRIADRLERNGAK